MDTQLVENRVNNIVRHEPKDWKASAYLLKHVDPENFGDKEQDRRLAVDVSVDITTDLVAEARKIVQGDIAGSRPVPQIGTGAVTRDKVTDATVVDGDDSLEATEPESEWGVTDPRRYLPVRKPEPEVTEPPLAPEEPDEPASYLEESHLHDYAPREGEETRE